jgi:hypothetical protein
LIVFTPCSVKLRNVMYVAIVSSNAKSIGEY